MSFTTENIVAIVTANPEESAAVFNCFHQLNSGLSAFNLICKEHNIKKPRGGYKKNKRPPSAYNVFTKAMYEKHAAKLKKMKDDGGIGACANFIGGLWKKLSDKDKANYKPAPVEAEQKDAEPAAPAPAAKPKAKKAAKKKGKKKPAAPEPDSDDDLLDSDGDVSD